MDGSTPWILFGCAAVVSWATVLAVRPLARRLGILDRPGAHKGHAAPVPLLGSVGVAAGVVVSLAVLRGALEPPLEMAIAPTPPAAAETGFLTVLPWWFAVGLALALGTGLVDDLVATGLSPARKLAGQTLAAAAFSLGFVLAHGEDATLAVGATAAAAAAAIVLVTNAFNLLDNMNGLSAGAGAILLGAIAWIAAASEEPWIAATAIAVSGGLAGFLPQNYPRARIFLGDGGSHLVGYSVSALAIAAATSPRSPGWEFFPWMLPAVLFALPVLDVVWVVARRRFEGRSIFVGDRGHLSHRLVSAGFSPAGAVAALWAYAAWTGVAAILLSRAAAIGAAALVAAAWIPGAAFVASLVRRELRSR